MCSTYILSFLGKTDVARINLYMQAAEGSHSVTSSFKTFEMLTQVIFLYRRVFREDRGGVKSGGEKHFGCDLKKWAKKHFGCY